MAEIQSASLMSNIYLKGAIDDSRNITAVPDFELIGNCTSTFR
jgi:hypothetical protein